jgi:hypothetical protein
MEVFPGIRAVLPMHGRERRCHRLENPLTLQKWSKSYGTAFAAVSCGKRGCSACRSADLKNRRGGIGMQQNDK